MAASFSTEQLQPITFSLKDGRGRAAAFDGDPVAAVSDETIVKLSADGVKKNDDGSYGLTLEPVTAGEARVTVSGDADLGEGVNSVTGFLDVSVTLDDRTGARIVEMTAGAPTDRPV